MQINIQPIEKLDRASDGSLEVHSIFYTVQGEGPFAGRPAVFVRLAGCNLQCPGCDTEYTNKRTRMGASEITQIVRRTHGTTVRNRRPIVVITGGEPFRQDITNFCHLLIENGYVVQIETNGTLPVSPGFAQLYSSDERWTDDVGMFRSAMNLQGPFIVVSPKNDKVQPSVESHAIAYKYVVDVQNGVELDGLPKMALDHPVATRLARPSSRFGGIIYLQPRDMQDDRLNAANRELALNMCFKHGYTLQLQIHKLLGVE